MEMNVLKKYIYMMDKEAAENKIMKPTGSMGARYIFSLHFHFFVAEIISLPM